MSHATSLSFAFLSSKMRVSSQVTDETPSSLFNHLWLDWTLPTALCKRQAKQCSLSSFYRWGSWGRRNELTGPSLNLTSSGRPFRTTSFTKSVPCIIRSHCSSVFFLPRTSISFQSRVKQGFCGHINLENVRLDQVESLQDFSVPVLMLMCSDLQHRDTVNL